MCALTTKHYISQRRDFLERILLPYIICTTRATKPQVLTFGHQQPVLAAAIVKAYSTHIFYIFRYIFLSSERDAQKFLLYKHI